MHTKQAILTVDSTGLQQGFRGRIYDFQTAYAWIEHELKERRMEQSLRALEVMWEAHFGQRRADGQPYAIHPLRMAERALRYQDPNVTDELIAVNLLHDTVEEEGLTFDEIAENFSEAVLHGVERMTIVPRAGEGKLERRKRTFQEMLFSKEATIARAFDRQDTLSTMSAAFDDADKIRKNVVETDALLLPQLERARETTWSEAGNLLWLLIDELRMINDNLALFYGVRLSDEGFWNETKARDYKQLLD